MNKTILIVDDEPVVLETVATLVRHEGYDVMLAESGKRALEILAERSFDLVMTDLLMHEITGWQVLAATKQQYPDTKVIVFTGYVDEQGKRFSWIGRRMGFWSSRSVSRNLQTCWPAFSRRERPSVGASSP